MRGKMRFFFATVAVCVLAASVDAQVNPVTGEPLVKSNAFARPTVQRNVFDGGMGMGGDLGTSLRQGPIVYSQAPHDPVGNGFFSDGQAGQFWGQRMADDMTFGAPTVVNGVRWWGASEFYYFPDYTNFHTFRIQFYGDNGGTPGAPIGGPIDTATAGTNPTIVGGGAFGQNLYQQNVKFPAMTLPAGRVWMSIGSLNNSPSGDGWVWLSSANLFNNTFAADIGGVDGVYQTFSGYGDLAFEIQTIPEPATMLLLGLGGIAALRRRR